MNISALRNHTAPRQAGRRAGHALPVLGLLLVTAYLVLPPIAALVLGSVTDSPPGEAPAFTTETLSYAYGTLDHYRSLLNSIVYAALTATIVVVFGGVLAWIVARTDSALRHVAELFALVPILVPAVLFVTGWLLLLGPKGGLLNVFAMQAFGLREPPVNLFIFGGMVFVGVLQELPLAFLWLWPALRAMNPDLEDAALTAGARPFTVLRRVTLPLLRPAILSGWVLVFLYALGALAVPLLIGLPGQVILFSTEIYLAVHRVPSDLNLASAYALLLVVTSILGLVLYRRATAGAGRFATITGKAYNPRLVRLGRWRPAVTLFGLLILMLVAGLPMLVILWEAFLPFSQLPSAAAFANLTLGNFSGALHYGAAMRALFNSLLLGAAAGVVTTALGFSIAWCTLRARGPTILLSFLDQIATVPIAMPGLIVGVSVLWFYLVVPVPVYGTLLILLIAYVTLHLPYAVRICAAGLSQLHVELEQAAAVCGASWPTTFRRIVLPLIGPSICTSILYVGLRSFREYAASILLAGPGTEVFSVLVLDMWDGGNLNILCAYVTMTVCILIVCAALFSWVSRRVGVAAV